jgi:hypothetical protein
VGLGLNLRWCRAGIEAVPRQQVAEEKRMGEGRPAARREKKCCGVDEEAEISAGGRTTGDGEDGGPPAPCLFSFTGAVSTSPREARGWLVRGAGLRAGDALHAASFFGMMPSLECVDAVPY